MLLQPLWPSVSMAIYLTIAVQPRVAWLLAYVEATRTCKSDRLTWLGGLQQRLLMSRRPLGSLGSLLFDPEKLIWASSVKGNCGAPNLRQGPARPVGSSNLGDQRVAACARLCPRRV